MIERLGHVKNSVFNTMTKDKYARDDGIVLVLQLHFHLMQNETFERNIQSKSCTVFDMNEAYQNNLSIEKSVFLSLMISSRLSERFNDLVSRFV